MTVVAFRDGLLAADRLVCSDNPEGEVQGERTKIGRHGAARWALVGEMAGAQEIRDWLVGGQKGKQPCREAGGSVIWFEPENPPRIYSSGRSWVAAEAPFYAWGIGTPYALGAMTHGAGAREACAAAVACHVGCGGGIDCLEPA